MKSEMSVTEAAPVGEREAAIEAAYAAVADSGWTSVKDMGIQMFQAGAAYQRAQQPQATDWQPSGADWQPSGADYDRNIHANPDAKSWADFFVATFPGLADKHDLMLGWFANAMMAMHDYLKAQQPQSAEPAGYFCAPLMSGRFEQVDSSCAGDDDVFPLYRTPQPSAGVVMPSAEVLADLFVGCPLPKTVRVDQCALDPEYPHRFGTNLLTWGEAKLMFDEMLARLNGKETV